MPGILARRGPAPAAQPVGIFAAKLVALIIAAGAAPGAQAETAWPVTSAQMLRMPAQEADPQEQGQRNSGQPRRRAAALPGRRASGLAKAPACLPDRLTAVLQRIEEKWGPVRIISAHRPGARVRKTGRPSLHASCRAVDFRPPRGTYRAVAKWLKANHAGGVGTYSGGHNHIHIDARPCRLAKCYRWHN